MITGFNTDVEHDGVVYHVQTEDKGLGSPLILSLVYSGGAILAAKRSPYQDLIAAGFDEEVLSERLKKQHRLICAAITAGRIEELKRMGARVAPDAPAPPAKNTAPPIKSTALPAESTPPPAESTAPPANRTAHSTKSTAPPAESTAPPAEIMAPPAESTAREVYERFAIENASERPQVTEEFEFILETSSERWEPPTAVPEPPVSIPSPVEESVPRPRPRSKAAASAYTVYDSRRKAPAGAPAQSENGLVLSILDEGEFYAGDDFTIRILLQNRSGQTEKAVGGVTLSIKILGTGFRPKIFSVKTARDGVGTVSGQIPEFRSGRAAIVIRALVDDRSAELRKVIHPAA